MKKKIIMKNLPIIWEAINVVNAKCMSLFISRAPSEEKRIIKRPASVPILLIYCFFFLLTILSRIVIHDSWMWGEQEKN